MGEDEEEREGGKKDCIKEDRETDSGLANSDKDNVDKTSEYNKPSMKYFCSPMTNELPRKEKPPFPVSEKRFMVYICGGYKGKN